MVMLVSHADILLCGTWFVLLHPWWPPLSLPPPLPCRETQGQGGGEVSICKISEVTVTQVAELQLLQSLAGLQSAWIHPLILRLAHCVHYGAMMFTALRLQPWYNVCCDFMCCCSILFHPNTVLKQTYYKQALLWMWLPTTIVLILPTIHSEKNVKTNKGYNNKCFKHNVIHEIK